MLNEQVPTDPPPQPAVSEEAEAGGADELVEAHGEEGDAPSSSGGKPRHRQNFSWRQLAILEQVFDQDPLPKLVRGGRAARGWPCRG